jgi:importin subunit beta-1
MPSLVRNVGEGGDHLKQASLTTIGFICESQDADLRSSLVQHSNAILTAVVQGARKEEPNPEVRLAAIYALGDSLEFVESNFKNEGERNYIMQVICEATQAPDSRIQQGAFGCLNRIMALYYELMCFYMEKALFGLTIMGMKSEEEDVAKLAVEFWSTVCEEEIAIEDDNAQVSPAGFLSLSLSYLYLFLSFFLSFFLISRLTSNHRLKVLTKCVKSSISLLSRPKKLCLFFSTF